LAQATNANTSMATNHVSWLKNDSSWRVRWQEQGDRFEQYFLRRTFMVPGRTAPEADEEAFRAAVTFRAKLLQQGLIQEKRPAKPGEATDEGCDQHSKCWTAEVRRTPEQEHVDTPAVGYEASAMLAGQPLCGVMGPVGDGGASEEPPSTTSADGEWTTSSHVSDSEIEAMIDELFTPVGAHPSMQPQMQPKTQRVPPSPSHSSSVRSRTPRRRASDQNLTGCCTTEKIATGTKDSSPLAASQAATLSDASAADEAAPSTPPCSALSTEPRTTPQKTRRPLEQMCAPTAKIPGIVVNISTTGDAFAQTVAQLFADDATLEIAKIKIELAKQFSAAEVDSGLRRLDDANKVMIMDGNIHQV